MIGAHVIGPSPPWLKRHVETVTLDSLTNARRQLTIDVVLPDSADCSFAWREENRLFYLPIALMLKRPPASNIDMRNERDESLPVLNRLENAEVTSAAVAARMESIVGAELLAEVGSFVERAICEADEQIAKTNAVFAITRMIALKPTVQRHKEWQWLVEFLALLSAHSLSWLGLAGLPGERRVIKFAYDIRMETPKPIPRRARRISRRVRAVGASGSYEVYYDDWELGDGYPHGFIVRMVKRFVTIIGGSAYHIPIETPYIRNTPSYHLQVRAPEGLETRRVELLAELCDAEGRVVSPIDATTPDCAHLYFSEASVRRMGKAIVSLRVGRRGLLSYSLVACAAIAAMLWEFADHHAAIAAGSADSRAAAVAVLLLVPTLMLLFAIRPGEHSLATQLLSGLRGILAVEALLCVAAAAVLVGVEPFHEDLPTLWRFAADVATVLAVLVGTCWFFSFMMLEGARAYLRRRLSSYWVFAGTASFLAALAWAWLLQTDRFANLRVPGDYVDWLALGLIGAASVWVASFSSATEHRENARLVAYALFATGAVALLAAANRARLGHTVISWAGMRGAALVVVPAVLAFMALAMLAHLFGRPREGLTIADEARFYVGPSGVSTPGDSTGSYVQLVLDRDGRDIAFAARSVIDGDESVVVRVRADPCVPSVAFWSSVSALAISTGTRTSP